MRRVDMDSAFRRVRDIRLALAGLLVLSMTVNLALGIGLAGREAVTVMVPGGDGSGLEGRRRARRRPVSGRHCAHRGGDAADAHA